MSLFCVIAWAGTATGTARTGRAGLEGRNKGRVHWTQCEVGVWLRAPRARSCEEDEIKEGELKSGGTLSALGCGGTRLKMPSDLTVTDMCTQPQQGEIYSQPWPLLATSPSCAPSPCPVPLPTPPKSLLGLPVLGTDLSPPRSPRESGQVTVVSRFPELWREG